MDRNISRKPSSYRLPTGGREDPRQPFIPEEGSILIVVLWWLVILTIMAVALFSLVQPRINLAARLKKGAEARSAAHAAAEMALLQLAADETPGFDALKDPWSNNEAMFRNLELGNMRATVGYVIKKTDLTSIGEDRKETLIRYGFQDEERKLNINEISIETLERLFEKLGQLGSIESRTLAAAVADWRDEDDAPETHGAEATYYKTLSPPYACRDAPFKRVEEIMLVKNITPEIFNRIQEHITVYGRGAVNLNTTGAAILECLGIDASVAESIVRYRAGPDGVAGNGDDNVFERVTEINENLEEQLALSRDQQASIRRAVNSGQLTVRSDNFRGQILSQLDNPAPKVQITFVINRNGVIREWREY